jgi:hypothetical protein
MKRAGAYKSEKRKKEVQRKKQQDEKRLKRIKKGHEKDEEETQPETAETPPGEENSITTSEGQN